MQAMAEAGTVKKRAFDRAFKREFHFLLWPSHHARWSRARMYVKFISLITYVNRKQIPPLDKHPLGIDIMLFCTEICSSHSFASRNYGMFTSREENPYFQAWTLSVCVCLCMFCTNYKSEQSMDCSVQMSDPIFG